MANERLQVGGVESGSPTGLHVSLQELLPLEMTESLWLFRDHPGYSAGIGRQGAPAGQRVPAGEAAAPDQNGNSCAQLEACCVPEHA